MYKPFMREEWRIWGTWFFPKVGYPAIFFPKTTSARVGFWEDRPWNNAMIIPKMCVAEVSSSNTGSIDRAHFGISLRTDNDGGFFVVCWLSQQHAGMLGRQQGGIDQPTQTKNVLVPRVGVLYQQDQASFEDTIVHPHLWIYGCPKLSQIDGQQQQA